MNPQIDGFLVNSSHVTKHALKESEFPVLTIVTGNINILKINIAILVDVLKNYYEWKYSEKIMINPKQQLKKEKEKGNVCKNIF